MKPDFLVIPILIPIICGIIIYFLRGRTHRRTRELFIGGSVLVTTAAVWAMILMRPEGSCTVIHLADGINITFKLDGLGSFFAGLVSTLWPFATLYAFEYMAKEPRRNMFFAFYTMTYGITLGIAFAGNMLTMYFFYEMLTLITLPLVMHKMDKISVRAGRKYLFFSIGGSAFAFMGLVLMLVYGSAEGFISGGVMSTVTGSIFGKNIFLFIYIFTFFGFGVKSAVFPLHAWLPTASVAPTPVTALLHAVAVVKAGVFAIMRLTYYNFGTDYLRGTWAQNVVMIAVIFTIFYGSSMALRERHFKRRLAYSTVSNLSYILFGVTMMTTAGLAAGLLHMMFHSVIKICAFFCAGAVMHSTEREYIFELDGMGRKMPVTFTCYAFSALALTGIPPFCGFVSKWQLSQAALASGTVLSYIGIAVLLISALLTAMYMISIVVRAFVPARGEKQAELEGAKEVNMYMKLPMALFALLALLMGIFSEPIIGLMTKIAGGLI